MKRYFKYLLILLIIPAIFVLLNYSGDFKVEKDNSVKKRTVNESQNGTQLLKEKYQNNDIVGSISIDGVGINEPILQYTDNDYYLTHDNYGRYDKYGSVFLDYRCNKDSKKLLIFGHNFYNSDTPFSKLENYYEESYYKQNQYLNILLDNESRRYQIFSVYIETEDFTYMNLKIDDEQYNNDLIKYKNNSFYQTNVDVNANDEILILQTCSNNSKYKKYKDKFLLIIAKRIE